MKTALFIALFTVAQSATLTDLKALFKGQPQTYTCSPGCGGKQCCVHFATPIHGGRRQSGISIDPAELLKLQNMNAGAITTMCKDIPAKGGRCLVHNTGEWCDCDPGLTCRADGDIGLDRFFGTCV